MDDRNTCPHCGTMNRANRSTCWSCNRKLSDAPDHAIIPPVSEGAEADLVTPHIQPTIQSSEKPIAADTSTQTPPIFGSSCWIYGLWFASISSLRQLGQSMRILANGDTSGAFGTVLISLVLFTLAASVQVSRTKRAGSFRTWTWLNFLPTAFVTIFGMWMYTRHLQMRVPPVSDWVNVMPAGTNCTILMPTQPTELARPAGLPDGVTARSYNLIHGRVAFNIQLTVYPHGTVDSLDAVSARIASGLAAKMEAHTRDKQDAALDRWPAKEFTIDDEAEDKTIIVRLCTIGDRIYILMYGAPLNGASPLIAHAYFNSFHVNGN